MMFFYSKWKRWKTLIFVQWRSASESKLSVWRSLLAGFLHPASGQMNYRTLHYSRSVFVCVCVSLNSISTYSHCYRLALMDSRCFLAKKKRCKMTGEKSAHLNTHVFTRWFEPEEQKMSLNQRPRSSDRVTSHSSADHSARSMLCCEGPCRAPVWGRLAANTPITTQRRAHYLRLEERRPSAECPPHCAQNPESVRAEDNVYCHLIIALYNTNS